MEDTDGNKKKYLELFYLIRKLRANENNCSHSMTKGIGGILYELQKNPNGITPGELSERLAVGSGRIGNALKSMEEKGAIERKTDPDDHRKVLVTLTDKGREFINQLQKQFEEKLDYVIDKLGEEKFEEYLKLSHEFIEYFIDYENKEDKTHD